MLVHIVSALLAGLILSWFGFDKLVINGMKEIFGVSISTTGYYFLFAILGALRGIGSIIGASFNSDFKPFEWKSKK